MNWIKDIIVKVSEAEENRRRRWASIEADIQEYRKAEWKRKQMPEELIDKSKEVRTLTNSLAQQALDKATALIPEGERAFIAEVKYEGKRVEVIGSLRQGKWSVSAAYWVYTDTQASGVNARIKYSW